MHDGSLISPMAALLTYFKLFVSLLPFLVFKLSISSSFQIFCRLEVGEIPEVLILGKIQCLILFSKWKFSDCNNILMKPFEIGPDSDWDINKMSMVSQQLSPCMLDNLDVGGGSSSYKAWTAERAVNWCWTVEYQWDNGGIFSSFHFFAWLESILFIKYFALKENVLQTLS